MGSIDYFKIIALVGAVITFIVAYFKKEQDKYTQLVEDYFEKVLILYVDKYSKNNKINPIEFIKENYSMKDYYIPSYIFYLVNNNRKIDLHKVLVEDYRERFPDNSNAIFKTIDKLIYTYSLFQVFIFCILFAIPIVFIGLIALLIIGTLISGISEGFRYEVWSGILGLIVIGVGAGGTFVLFRFLAKYIAKGMRDEYTMKTKEIEGQIVSKINKYDEKINDYYLI